MGPHPVDGCPSKERLGPTNTQKQDHVKTQMVAGHLQAKASEETPLVHLLVSDSQPPEC